jgi:MFS family permease
MAPAANSSNDVTSSSRENYHAAADALQSSGYPTDKDKKVAHSIPTSISKTFGESSLLSLQAEQPNSDVEISESEPKNEPAAPPPDGGLQAWLQVLIAHLVIFNTWGYINLFGVFQTYYLSTLEQSPLQISWIGSVQVFLLFFIGTFSGRAIDAGYFRHTFVIGTVLILLGVFTTLVCTQYWQLFLAQGVCTGIGNGLLFCPTLAILPIYFNKKRVIVVRLAASGTTTGGIIIPGIFEALLPRVGFGWTLCVLGLIMLVFQVVYFLLARTRVPPCSPSLSSWRSRRSLTSSLL